MHNKIKTFLGTSLLGVLFATQAYGINCNDFTEFKSYGGHYYATTIKRMSFDTAKAFAQKNGGYLAIPETSGENDFIASIIPNGRYAWIGVYDPNYTQNHCLENKGCSYDASRFRNIKTNGAVAFSKWATRQPDNLLKNNDVINGKEVVSPLGEHWVAMAFDSGEWADFGNHAGDEIPKKEYAVIEFESQPICHSIPETDIDDTLNIVGQCNSWTSDDPNYSIDESKGMQSFTCLNDINGELFCPIGLTECKVDTSDKVEGSSKKVEAKIYMQRQFIDISFYRNVGYEAAEFVDLKFIINDLSKIDTFKAISLGADDWVVMYKPNQFINTAYERDTQGLIYVPWNPDGNYYELSRWTSASSTALNKIEMLPYLKEGENFVRLFFRTVGTGGWGATLRLIGEGISCENNIQGSGFTCNSGDYYDHYSYYEYTCPANYTPIEQGGNCNPSSIKDLIDTNNDGVGDACPNNPSTPPALNCQASTKVCPYNKERGCVEYDGKLQCSPHPCFVNSNGGDPIIEVSGNPTGVNDADNNGWNEDGSCSGEILIFNGKDNRCRSGDKLLGLTGGGCCDKDKVFLGLISCKESEKNLAKQNEQKKCHEVGEYCSKKINLGFSKICIQNSKSYCCFNSLLGRIFQEQGRQQLGIGWGSGDSPNCRGFTPEQFQKLDFSRINLQEFIDTLTIQVDDSFAQRQSQKIKDKINANLNATTGKN